MNSFVSVIICTHNRKRLVMRAIDSALAQQNCELEVLVVDDCSQDGTLDFLGRHYLDNVKLLSTDKNSGRAVASNIGYEHSKGTYIALLDDDDYWIDEYKLRKQIDIMQNRPSLGVLGTWWVELRPNDVKDEKMPVPPKKRYFLIERLLAGGGVVSGSSPLLKRDAWKTVGGMDINQVKGIDSDLYRRIALAGYDVDVLQEVTTVADAAHDFERMTPAKDIDSKRRHLQGHIQVLFKHIFVYFLYPRALAWRLYSVLRALLSLLDLKCRNSLGLNDV